MLPILKIAFCGKMRSGKDTAAERVASQIGSLYSCDILKFADPLYDIMHFAQNRAGIKPGKDRKFLQLVGTDWGRNTVGQDIWTNAFKLDVEATMDKRRSESFFKSICILNTDARFHNEINTLKELGFTIIKIHRPEEARIAEGAELMSHASESEIDELSYDYLIENSGNLDQFYFKVDSILFTVCNKINASIIVNQLNSTQDTV